MEITDFLQEELLQALRTYQLEALSKINEYIMSDSEKQALVKMPMGTGKTTIIASLASCFPNINNCLVVTSSIAVKEQLLQDIETNVWENLGINHLFQSTKTVVELMPTNANIINNNEISAVYVCTIQSLLRIKNRNEELYSVLKDKVDLIMFDEGHREPAQQWQRTIRDFGKRVVLFSATPVRNDSSKFSIDGDYTYLYSYQDAVQERYVREVAFFPIESRQESNLQNIREFAFNMKAAYESYIEQYQCEESDVKVIIRCGNENDIKLMVKEINDLGLSVKGIHETFTSQGEPLLIQKVPRDIRNDSTTFWIHQYKLIEGLDSYKFCILGIFESFTDHRSLIQQIGRVIRKKHNEGENKAHIYIWYYQNYQEKWWDLYCEYEEKLDEQPDSLVFNYTSFLDQIISSIPPVLYENRKFLTRYEIEKEIEVELKLLRYQIPQKTNIYESLQEIQEVVDMIFTQLVQDISEELINKDCLILDRIIIEELYSASIVYSYYINSPFLVNESFLEPKIGIITLRIINNTLFFYDTNNFHPQCIKEHWKRVPAQRLKKLFDEDTLFSSVTVQNGSVNYNNYNRMILHSEDIARIVPSISDQYNFLTTIQGKKSQGSGKPLLRRYIGFSNARISQNSTLINLEKYIEWLYELNVSMTSDISVNEFFERYAPVSDVPPETQPVSILFKLEDVDLLKNNNDQSIILDSFFFTVSNGIFKMNYLDKNYEVDISFESTINEYRLELNGDEELELFYDNKNLLQWLNDSQSFQLMIKKNKYRYYKGHFYKIGIPKNYLGLSVVLDENIIQIPTRTTIKEKGKYFKGGAPRPNTDMWDSNSLFFLVAKQGLNIQNSSKLKTILDESQYIICTDLGSEIADFITVSESTNTVCFIHCKAGKTNLSASAFQEVCGQVVKNLDYVHSSSDRLPKNLDDWNGQWKHNSYKAVVDRRVINTSNISSQEIWGKLKEIQSRPDSNTLVIALVGDTFSKEKYDRENNKEQEKQKAEKVQLDYLLLETAIAVERAQAKFLIAYTKKI